MSEKIENRSLEIVHQQLVIYNIYSKIIKSTTKQALEIPNQKSSTLNQRAIPTIFQLLTAILFKIWKTPQIDEAILLNSASMFYKVLITQGWTTPISGIFSNYTHWVQYKALLHDIRGISPVMCGARNSSFCEHDLLNRYFQKICNDLLCQYIPRTCVSSRQRTNNCLPINWCKLCCTSTWLFNYL